MAKMYTKYPTLAQACFQAYTTSAVFAGFWTTLTFLLSDSPYHYSTLQIGLFGLLGLIAALLSPLWGYLIDQVHPYLAQLVGIWVCLISMIIGLTAAKVNVSAVCIAIAFYDVGQQLNQLGNGYRVAGIDPNARARLNGCNLLALFAGQVGLLFLVSRYWGGHKSDCNKPDFWYGDHDQDLQFSWLVSHCRNGCCLPRCGHACTPPTWTA